MSEPITIPRRARLDYTGQPAHSRYANHAACDNCGNRINGYVYLDQAFTETHLCADCLAIGMGITDFIEWIDTFEFDSTDTPPF